MHDREKAIVDFETIINICKEDGCDFVDLSYEAAEYILATLKEQDAKPLRCKECSYHRNDGWCNEHGREVKESDYCSFGAWEGR